jgi:predicted Zn-ribbon and HTH transcriptional regulator
MRFYKITMAAAKTIRQQIFFLLSDTEMTASDLSHSLGIREKEVHEHLPHVYRSATAQGLTLQIRPSECLKCGFVFKERSRFTPPGRCPHCKGTYLQKPTFKIYRPK